MNRLNRYLIPLLVLAVVLVGFVGWLFGSGHLGGTRAELLTRRGTFVNAMQAVRTQRKDRPELDRRESVFIDRSLGGSMESVDSRLRERLYALGSVAGLSDLSVSTTGTASSSRGTPARREFDRRGTQRVLRDEIDFVEVGATVVGEGTLEQVLRMIGWLDADGWIKRLVQIQMNPNADGSRIRLTLRLTTLFLPNRVAGALPGPGELDQARITSLAGLNPFRIPPPPPPETPVAPPPDPVVSTPAPKPPENRFPYDSWVLTGVAIGPDGPEAWLRNAKSRKRRTLRPGGSIGEAVLVRIDGDEATFKMSEASFEVRIGRSLATGLDANQ
jgi:hypothetical protein